MIYLDIESRSAHFRNHFYNSSLISYPYPTRTMVIGLLSSILGFNHDSYHNKFLNAKIAVCIKTEELYKDTVVVNHREPTKMRQATQVYIEYVKSLKGNVCYRIYYIGEFEEEIISMLTNYNGYHLYLGATECLASIITFMPIQFKKIKTKNNLIIDSILPLQIIDTLQYKSGDLTFNLKYERYRNIYGWQEERGKSLGVYDCLCETLRGKIYCKLNENLEITIAKLKDNKPRIIKGELLKTESEDLIYVF